MVLTGSSKVILAAVAPGLLLTLLILFRHRNDTTPLFGLSPGSWLVIVGLMLAIAVVYVLVSLLTHKATGSLQAK